MLDIALITIVVLLGFGIVRFTNSSDLDRKDKKTLNFLWGYHLLFSFLFYVYTQNNSADANGYWRIAKEASVQDLEHYIASGPGTFFVYVLNYFPSNILDLHILTGTFLYSLLSFIGLFLFYRLAKFYIPYNTKLLGVNLFPAIFFLPSIHFWTAGVGKDTLMLFCIGLFAFSAARLKKRNVGILLAMGLAYMIRPHVFVLLLAAFSFAYLFTSKIMGYKRFFLFLFLALISILVLPKVFEYANIDNYSVDSVFSRIDKQAENLSGSRIGSSFDISSYSYPMRFFTFLFRPLFFDARSVLYLLASFENLLLLVFTIKMIRSKPIRTFKESSLVFKGFLIFILFGTFLFSSVLGNLGIILRMKIMFLPGFLLYSLWAFSYKYQSLNDQNPSKK